MQQAKSGTSAATYKLMEPHLTGVNHLAHLILCVSIDEKVCGSESGHLANELAFIISCITSTG